MIKPPTYYELIQVDPEADSGLIKYAFRTLATMYHPENKDTGDHEMFKQVTEAYKMLSAPERRGAYDEFIKDPAPKPISFYSTLKVDPNACDDIIRRAYYYLAARCAEDTSKDYDQEMRSKISEAWETLSDPERKAAYDESSCTIRKTRS